MLGEFGNLFLALALGFSCAQVVASLKGGQKRWEALGRTSAFFLTAFTGLAFLTLGIAFFLCDFSLLTVVLHDHTSLPWYYRIAATWGNHEGSLLLFILILALANAALASFLSPLLRAKTLVFQGILLIGFLTFLLGSSNPFNSLPFPLPEGKSLNPLLQDKGLLLHPPLLYIGYAWLSAPFSLALAILWEGREEGIPSLRPYVLFAWAFLTAGITLGSWWAYYELGWGGWWFWDPIENISLMPWLATTALLHTLLTKKLYPWSLFLCLLSFGLSLIGTFLVRSGLMISVHSFASDPTRGKYLITLIGFFLTGAFSLWAWKAKTFSSHALNFLSREGLLFSASLFLSLALGILMLGTFYPLANDFLGGPPLSIGAPYFEKTLIPLTFPLFFLIPIGSLFRNRQAPLLPLLLFPFTAFLASLSLLLYWAYPTSLAVLSGISLAIWVLSGTFLAFIRKRLSSGAFLAHMGVGITLLGLSVGGGFREDKSLPLGPQESLDVAGISFTLRSMTQGTQPTYTYQRAHIHYPGGLLTPEKRLYFPQNLLLSETTISTNGLRDIYVSLGPYQGNGRWLIRLSYIPLAPWIWIGGALMVMGAAFSLFQSLRYLQKKS